MKSCSELRGRASAQAPRLPLAGMLVPLLGCRAPSAADTDTAAGATVTAAPTPPEAIRWQGCAQIYAPGGLGEADAHMAFAPAPLGDRLWFGVKGEEGPQRVAGAALDVIEGEPVISDPEIVLDPEELGGFVDASSPAVLRAEDGSWSLYFDATRERGALGIWRCDSDDGVTWGGCDEVLPPGAEGTVDIVSAQIPRVLDMGDHLRLWYTALDAVGVRRIATARSDDGWRWEEARLALDLGAEGEWDLSSLYSAYVWPDAGGYRMLYAGRAPWEGYEVKRLIEAWSDDGLTWTRFEQAMDLGCAGAADAWRVDSPWVVPEGEGWRLYYDGFDDPITDVGRRSLLTASSAG